MHSKENIGFSKCGERAQCTSITKVCKSESTQLKGKMLATCTLVTHVHSSDTWAQGAHVYYSNTSTVKWPLLNLRNIYH